MKRLVWFLILLYAWQAGAKTREGDNPSQQIFVFSSAKNAEQNLLPVAQVLVENELHYNSSEILSGKFDSLFRAQELQESGQRYCDFWIKLSLGSTDAERTNWILHTDKRYSEVTAYIIYANGKTDVQKSGWSLPLSKRSFADPEVAFKLSLDANEQAKVYFRVHTDLRWSSVKKIQLGILPEAYWYQKKLKTNSFLAVYAGFCLLAVFYWLITFIYSRRLNYLLLIWATVSALIFCLDIYGITAYLFDSYPWHALVQYGEQLLWFPLMVASYYAIAIKTNPFHEHFSRMVIIAYWTCCGITTGLLVSSPFLMSWHDARAVSLSAVLISIGGGIIFINMLLFGKGHKDAFFGFLTILAIMLGITGYILSELHVLPPLYMIAAPIGCFSTVIMFFYGMVIYVRVLRNKRKKESMEKEQLIRGQNVMLEREVANRTAELQVTNDELATALYELKNAQDQLITAEKRKENEIIRGRISQDIHDDVSSELTRISWISELAKANAVKGEISEMPTLLDKINSSSRETVTKLGEIIWAINPNSDTVENLLSYMRNYIAKFLADTPIKYEINFPDLSKDLSMSPELKRNLFLVLKEALNNALKYSQASLIRIVFKIDSMSYSLSISDNGVGMNGAIQGSGNGLQNMRRRMQQVHGNCTIESQPGKGTAIVLTGNIY